VNRHRANRIAELPVQSKRLIAERESSNDNFSLDAKMLLFSIETVILPLTIVEVGYSSGLLRYV
jgi:hypothetical protein